MPISQPGYVRPSRGTVWWITGVPYKSQTRIRLLARGKYAECIRNHPELVDIATTVLVEELRNRAPVHTGRLRSSIHVTGRGRFASVLLGPDPFDRYNVVRAMEGKPPRQHRGWRPGGGRRRTGRAPLAKYYALPANVRSRRPAYVEQAIDAAAARLVELCKQFDAADRALAAIPGGVLRRR